VPSVVIISAGGRGPFYPPIQLSAAINAIKERSVAAPIQAMETLNHGKTKFCASVAKKGGGGQ